MSDRVKIGPRVDADLWREFRQSVKKRKGQTRGVLGDELENAIREYLGEDSTPTLRRMEKRIARIEREVGAAPTDGGSTLPEPSEHTHTPSRLQVDSKPPANAATEKKVAYLAGCITDDLGEFLEIPKSKIVDTVKDEYGFRSDTAERYVERVADYFDLEAHPQHDHLLAKPERREELLEEERERRREEADDKLQQ